MADQNRQREIAVATLCLGQIGFEKVLIIEDQMRPLALDDQRIERRKNMHAFSRTVADGFQHLGFCPMLLLAGALKRNRHQFLAANARLDQMPYSLLARCVEMT